MELLRWIMMGLLVIAGHRMLGAQILDFNFVGAGARAAGMGQAFIGVADDATSVIWNPGGLTKLEKPEVSSVMRVDFDVWDWTGPNASWDDLDEEFSHASVNFGSFAWPFDVGEQRLVVAAAYQRQIDFFSNQEDGDYESRGGIVAITPAAAYRITPWLSAGVAANIWTGSPAFKIVDNGTFKGNLEYSGFNVVAGAMVDLDGLQNKVPLKIGAVLRTPFVLKEKDKGDIVGRGDRDMPLMLGFGASYRIGENLTVAADFETRQFGNSKITQDGSEEDLSQSGKNLVQLRAGAEYLLVSDFAVIPFRAGFQTVPTLFADQEWDGSQWVPTNKQVAGTGLTFGSGLIFERFALDAAFMRTSHETKFIDTGKREIVKNVLIFSGIFYF